MNRIPLQSYLKKTLLVIFLFISISAAAQDSTYDFNRDFKIEQLQSDFLFIRKTLETNHPRLYEYTAKKDFDQFFDSLYTAIGHPMTEREFQYFMLPVIGKVHCSHTKLTPSLQFLRSINDNVKAPPFKLFFTSNKAYIEACYIPGAEVRPGAEVFSVNGVSVNVIRENFLCRLPNEGLNKTFMYNRFNTGVWPNNGMFGLFPGLCDYPVKDYFDLVFINPGQKQKRHVRLVAMKYDDFPPVIKSRQSKLYNFQIIDTARAAVMTILSYNVPYAAFESFVDSSFAVINQRHISNLIIDVRGNIGGIPETSVELLSYIMKKDFIYYSKGNGYEDLKTLTQLADHPYNGKLYILFDGAGRSTTGHFLAMCKYYKLGVMIGEESGTSWSCNDNGKPFILPNTKLILQCPGSIYEIAVQDLGRGRGIMPDYAVLPNIENIITGNDVVMKVALRMCVEKKQKVRPDFKHSY